MSDEKEEKLKEKYTELLLLDSQIKQLQQQLETFEKQIMEIETIKIGLNELKDVKEETNILVPVHQGIFARAKLSDTNDFIVNVGADVAVKKSSEDTRLLLDKQLGEITKYRERIVNNLQALTSKAQALQNETLELAK